MYPKFRNLDRLGARAAGGACVLVKLSGCTYEANLMRTNERVITGARQVSKGLSLRTPHLERKKQVISYLGSPQSLS